jgi:hypothetical protein
VVFPQIFTIDHQHINYMYSQHLSLTLALLTTMMNFSFLLLFLHNTAVFISRHIGPVILTSAIL